MTLSHAVPSFKLGPVKKVARIKQQQLCGPPRQAPLQAVDMSKADGGDLPNIFYLRNTVDADALLKGIKAAKEAGNKVTLHFSIQEQILYLLLMHYLQPAW